MQLIIDIPSNSLGNKIIQILKAFKSDGVEIETIKNQIPDEEKLSDEYLKKNWKEILMGTKSSPDYYKSEQYYEDRGDYLMEKYK